MFRKCRNLRNALTCGNIRRVPQVSLEPLRRSGDFLLFRGCFVVPDDGSRPDPVTATDAARRLDKAPSTVRCWAFRFNALKLGAQDGKVYYDYADLSVIERELRHGHPVPATPEERAAISQRCPLRAAERLTAAA
jgi:hypothetical protein